MSTEFAAGSLSGASTLPGTPELQFEWARRWLDPACATGTVHWGRNYLYRAAAPPESGVREAVVKQYRWASLAGRLKRFLSGDRAERSFEAACALLAQGLPVARPLLWAADRERSVSIYVSELLDGWTELRYPLRARKAGTEREQFPRLEFPELLDAVARLARRLHDAGFWFRDFSAGNLLLGPGWFEAGGNRELALVDLARCREQARVSTLQRLRDLARLPFASQKDLERCLRAYFDRAPRRVEILLLRLLERGFHGRHELKRSLRSFGATLRRSLFRRSTHAHIPPPPAGASAREQIVWDALSDQPHGHTSRAARFWIRLADLPEHLRHAGSILASAPAVARNFQELRRAPLRPVLWPATGVGLRPDPERREALLEAFDELGLRRALLRLHPWEEDHEEEERLAQALASRGVELALALPQNRELVRDRRRWQRKVEELGRRFLPWASRVQIGQAVNRSKWGIWHPGEYLDLARDAVEILRSIDPAVELAGPAVIDFELHHASGLLRRLPAECRFDRLSTLLYVDRRGAPEARQLGFDSESKALLAAAIARSSPGVARSEIWISEVNWPLREGPHSPAGRHVAVDEATQARYLARYLLLVSTTGQVDRVDWWQLSARGYGLLEPLPAGGYRKRPAFAALAGLERTLRGTRLRARLQGASPLEARAFLRPDGRELWALWCSAGRREIPLAGVPEAVWDLAGRPRRAGSTLEVDEEVTWLLWSEAPDANWLSGNWRPSTSEGSN